VPVPNRIQITTNSFLLENRDEYQIVTSAGYRRGSTYREADGSWTAARARFPYPGENVPTVAGFTTATAAALAFVEATKNK